jgi:hypothetical protein
MHLVNATPSAPSTPSTPPTPSPDHLLDAIQQFVIDQGAGRTDETVERYVQVAADIHSFMAAVDVAPWLGPEIATYLDGRREQLGVDALLTSLGLMSFIRVLPAFVAEPWLPPPGAQRRTHRAAVRYLMVFLRRLAHDQGCHRREDFRAIDKALGHAYSYDLDRPTAARTGTVTYTVTLDLVEHLVDRMLEDIEEGRYTTLDEAVAARINPVKVEVWRDPEPYPPHYDGFRGGW